MKIIKPGVDRKKVYPPVRFTCSRCTCVFELSWEELGDYPHRSDRNTLYAQCPNCKEYAEETRMR